ncbi:MAG: enhanced serine sensitivity protein SseB [Lachnospiraceae bacterium]|nr:enhanced serine sensitivity protein SseB [Lachnospiraceae bacterium]MBO7601118.1 enhanced serine sensitivity protein SseB [Lachnospiraceae bacterium]
MINWDVNKPVENPYLNELLSKRAGIDTYDPEYGELMDKICKQIALDAVFLVVTDMDESMIEKHDDGTATFKAGLKIKFDQLKTQSGEILLPLFTDWENLRKWKKYAQGNPTTLIFSFDEICALTEQQNQGAIINAFGDNMILPPDLIKFIKAKKNAAFAKVDKMIIEKDTEVTVGEPSPYPTEMTEAIKEYAKTNKDINAIYLKLMIKDGEQSFLLTVDFKGDQNEIFNGIADAGREFLPKGMYIDIIPMDSDFGRKVADNEPFYKKRFTPFMVV